MSSTAADPWKVVFVLGPPGSGKGTQCKKIEQEFSFRHLSAGDLLREERNREGSEYGKLIQEHITNGTIVPVEITCKLLENAMIATQPQPDGFLIDGFPRNEDNNQGWVKEMGDKTTTSFVLFITCPDETAVQRCLSRGQGRTDDNEESLKKRLKGYSEVTMPIINLYKGKGLVREIDGTLSAEQVYDNVTKVFEAAGFNKR